MGYCVPPVLRLLLSPVRFGIIDLVRLSGCAVHMTLGIHQNGLVPACADIVGYDVFGHILTLLPKGNYASEQPDMSTVRCKGLLARIYLSL